MKAQMAKISTTMLAAALTSLVTAPCSASDAPIPYSRVVDVLGKAKGNAQSVTKQLVGKHVQLRIQTSGGFFFVRAADQVYFTCDRQAPGFKGGMITAKVTGYYESEGDSDPVFKLDHCGDTGASISGAAPHARVGALLYQHMGNAENPEPFSKSGMKTVTGKLVRDKDPGGWKYEIHPKGREPIRVAYERSDGLSDTLSKLEVKGGTVTLSGIVGTFPGGEQAFETSKPISITAGQ